MDVTYLTADSLKLKIKKTSVVFNPTQSAPKQEADAVLGLGQELPPDRVKDARVKINGVGEYEVGGLKITAEDLGSGLIYAFPLDNLSIGLVKTSSLSKIELDKIRDYEIAILFADEKVNQEAITAMEARVVIVFGPNGDEVAKELGTVTKAGGKVSLNEEKLPEETVVYLLS